jgi:hypothetical protein
VLGPHNREDAKLGVAGLAPQKLDYSVIFFVGESAASNEFGRDGGFAHIGGSLLEERTERITDMLPDVVRLYQGADGAAVAEQSQRAPRERSLETLSGTYRS